MIVSARTVCAAVMGAPIAHSLSPLLMKTWLSAAEIDGVYLAHHVETEQAVTAFKGLSALGYLGANVTAPHKITALETAETVSADASAIGAANLLLNRNGKLHAENTDATGFMTACRQGGLDLAAGPSLILGAGGAARAIIHALIQSNAPDIMIANRSPARAQALAQDLCPGADIIDWVDLNTAARRARTIISTLPAHEGDGDRIDWTACPQSPWVVDINYGQARGRFLSGARACGFSTLDGLTMLIEQARPSFEVLFGVQPPDHVDVESILRGALSS